MRIPSTRWGCLMLITMLVLTSIIPSSLTPAQIPTGEFHIVQGPSTGPIDLLVIGEDVKVPDEVELVDQYQGFIQVKASEDVVDWLDHAGYDIRPLPDLHTIEFDLVKFDARDGEPEIPPGLRDDSTDLYVVQLRGPVKQQWLKDLSFHGTILDNVRNNAYVIRLGPGEVGHIEDLEFVSWVGKYHPFYRIRTGFDVPKERTKANIIFFKDDRYAFERGLGAVLGLGGEILEMDDDTPWWNGARIEMPTSALWTLARLDGLDFIEPYDDPGPRLNKVRWVVQSYDTVNKLTPIWDHGINGTGIIVGGADTGIDRSHVAFRNSTMEVGTPSSDHRKIVQYNTSVDTWDDSSGHGTHTMGSIIGNNVSEPSGYYELDGVAFGARLAFYDVVLPSGTYDPPIMSDILLDAYDHGAESHSNSWGDDTTAYTSRSQRIDQFQWDHFEFLTFIAPGNGGVVWEPATAKNCVSVGNAYNGETKDIADSSAEGPANGNMINPHLVVPGMNIMSPKSDQNRTNSNFEYTALSGTSMSTPVAAGTGALVEQYFKDGFYPSGTRNPADGFTPSGPLKKATLINSGWDQQGGKKGLSDIGFAPNNQQGWGKVKLDDVLHFDGDTRGLWIYDGYQASEGQGLKTGEKDSYILNVNSTEPFEVTLVWNDFPGQGLKNDLDLTVLDPLGNIYLGNVYSQGQSKTGGVADASNPTETLLLKAPVNGSYIINVSAVNIRAQVYQRYSLVVTGAIKGANNGDVKFDRRLYGMDDTVGIRVVDTDLIGQGAIEVQVSSLTETTPEDVMLLEGDVSGVFRGTIVLSEDASSPDGKLQVGDIDIIAVQYFETDPAGTRVDTADVDARPPTILNLRVTDITNITAVVRWETDEPATSNVSYGPSQALGTEKGQDLLLTEHTITLTGLLPSTLYYFDASSTDIIGNEAIDDNDGAHHSFRTASYILRAKADYAGWVREGENYNHFNDGIMYSGHFLNLTRHSAFLFDMKAIPDNADIVAASVRLYSRGGFGAFMTAGEWELQLLDPAINPKFNGTTKVPGYNDIQGTPSLASIGRKDGPVMGTDTWTTFPVPDNDLDRLEGLLPLNGAAFRMRGPTSDPDNMFSWDTGNTGSANSLGQAFAPQLILTLNLIPMVQPGAPTEVTINEDGSARLDLGTVFTDDGPLNYSITRPPSNCGNNISNGSLELTPVQDWNGEDYLLVKATDNDGLFSEHRLNITVTPVNDPPVMVSIGGEPVLDGMVLNATQDSPTSFKVAATDVDIDMEGDLLFYDVNASWIDIEGDNITFEPDNDLVGQHNVRVSVRDIEGDRDQVDVVIDISNINDPPVAVIYAPTEGLEARTNELVSFNASASYDIDQPFGDVLTFSWRSSLQGYIGDGVSLDKGLQAGAHKVTLTVMDKDGAADLAEVNVTVWGDTDGDGIYDPEDLDDDDDGMPDYWELRYGLDPLDPSDAKGDLDDDGATNRKEYRAGTDPTDPKDRPKGATEGSDLNPLLLYILLFLMIGLLIGGYVVHKEQTDEDGGIPTSEEYEGIDEEE